MKNGIWGLRRPLSAIEGLKGRLLLTNVETKRSAKKLQLLWNGVYIGGVGSLVTAPFDIDGSFVAAGRSCRRTRYDGTGIGEQMCSPAAASSGFVESFVPDGRNCRKTRNKGIVQVGRGGRWGRK